MLASDVRLPWQRSSNITGTVWCIAITLVFIISLQDAVEACWPARRVQCAEGEHPYHFGTQTFNCNNKFAKKQIRWRRSVPHRFTLVKSHRLLLYKGWVFDYYDNRAHMNRDFNVTGCGLDWEPEPAGCSKLSSACLRRCVDHWENKFWLLSNYNFVERNCHTFVNKLAELLYTSHTTDNPFCPEWCYD